MNDEDNTLKIMAESIYKTSNHSVMLTVKYKIMCIHDIITEHKWYSFLDITTHKYEEEISWDELLIIYNEYMKDST